MNRKEATALIAVSVVMPVFNTPVSILKEAVDSILYQSFHDLEFIIIDDGSNRETAAYLKALSDPRINLFCCEEHVGITKALNIGFQAAKGRYIARMDADDISHKERLKKQYEYMESHLDVVLCGCAIEEFGTKSGQHFTRINDPEEYRIKALFYYPGPCHPTFFIRREALIRYHISYNEELIYAQDYGFLVDISRCGGIIYSLPEVLLKRRHHAKRITSQYSETQKRCSMMTQEKQLCEILSNVTEEETELHYRFFSNKQLRDLTDFYKCFRWCIKLSKANHRTGKYSKLKFDLFVFKLFLLVTGQSFLPKVAASFLSWRNEILNRRNRKVQ